METDREMLGIATLALAEHEAWKVRNATRRAFRDWLKNYTKETGEFFDDGLSLPEDIEAHDRLKDAAKKAQRELTLKRCATRRAIVRATTATKEKPHE